MHISPVSQTTVKVIDKIVNSKNIPNTILFYNDYKNLGMSLVLNFIKKLTPKQKNIYNNPDISFVIPMTTTEKDYKEKLDKGDMTSIAEVLRDLYRGAEDPEQSYSERQLYELALDRFIRELGVIKKIDMDDAKKKVEDNLQKI